MKVFKYVAGLILIVIGFIALVTPLTPGAWLMFVGLELIGVRLTLWDNMKARIQAWRGIHQNNTSTDDTNETKA